MKKSQLIMIWLLPLVVIGGLFIPLLGYLVVAIVRKKVRSVEE